MLIDDLYRRRLESMTSDLERVQRAADRISTRLEEDDSTMAGEETNQNRNCTSQEKSFGDKCQCGDVTTPSSDKYYATKVPNYCHDQQPNQSQFHARRIAQKSDKKDQCQSAESEFCRCPNVEQFSNLCTPNINDCNCDENESEDDDEDGDDTDVCDVEQEQHNTQGMTVSKEILFYKVL